MTTPRDEELPTWLDREAWDAFTEMRAAKGKRAPFTVKARKMLLAKLSAMHSAGHDASDCLRESVMNGWSGVFPPKLSPGVQKTAPHQDGAWFQSRAGIEAMGEKVGVGRWNQAAWESGRGEQWPTYYARVRRAAEAQGVS